MSNRNFVRALRYAWPYRYRLILSAGAAAAVAVLWSLNLSAFYPVLKLFASNKNLQTWVKEEISNYESRANDRARLEQCDNLRRDIQAFQQKPASRINEQLIRKWTRELAELEGKRQDDLNWLHRYQLLEAHVIRHLPDNKYQTFVWIVVAVIIGVLIKGFFEFWQESLVGSVVSRSLFDLRNRFYQATVHQDTRQIQEIGTPDLMARMTNDAEQVGSGMKILFGKMIVEPLKIAACLAAAFWISSPLTIFFLVLVVPAVMVLGRVSRLMKKAARKVLERMGGLFKILRETFDGIKVVKAFTMEPAERLRFRKANEDYYRRSMKVIRLDAIAGPVVEVLGVAAVGVALLAGAYLVLESQTQIFGITMTDGQLGFESLLQLYVLLAAIADPVRRLSSVYSKIQSGSAASDRIFSLYDRIPRITANADGPVVPAHVDSVEFRHVCFSYVPGADPGTLNDINLTIRAGETLAVVGPNGCGEGTLLGLLPRFYDPDHGAVLVDGVNLRSANLRSLRKQIGLVTQDTVLFNDTIFANIAYGKPGATRDEVEAAARKAFAHEFIVLKPAGYDEQVGDFGSQLSGGQKQRLALARAILRDPRILILDEFTSQIDVESEFKIHQALKEFVCGRTTFLITHRLSTLELADRIAVMEAGRVVAVGTHPELLRGCPTYQRLYEAQVLGQSVEQTESVRPESGPSPPTHTNGRPQAA